MKTNDNQFCIDLFTSLCGIFENEPLRYRINKDACIATVMILPKGFYEVINSLQHKEYLHTLNIGFKDKGQRIEIYLKEKEDKTKYVVLKVFSHTNHIKTDYDVECEHYYTVYNILKRTFLIYNSKDIYTVSPKSLKGNKFYPAAVSDFMYAPIEISKYILPLYSNGSMIWKDFLAEKFFPPIKLNELSDYHNKKEFFEKQFSIELPKSVNKLPFLKTYAVCCAKDYIKPEQFLFLLSDMQDIDFSFLPNKRNKKTIATDYLKKYICKKNKTVNRNVVSDYIDFSLTLKEPIDILAGKKKILEYHDTLTDRMIFKINYGKKLVIPETPLKYLKLPKEFILLNTKKALIFEGNRNHNCVGGYVDNINKGRCIVYATDIDGEHLTIDIRCRKSRKKNKKYEFYVCQCYKAYNQPCKDKTLQYVKECVEDSSEKAVEKYIKINNVSQ